MGRSLERPRLSVSLKDILENCLASQRKGSLYPHPHSVVDGELLTSNEKVEGIL